jgi:hypothetical protein
MSTRAAPATLAPAAPRASAVNRKVVVSPVPSCFRTSSSARIGGRRLSASPSRAPSASGAGTAVAAVAARESGERREERQSHQNGGGSPQGMTLPKLR